MLRPSCRGGHVLQTIELDRGCFACTLGDADGTTLFMLAAEYPPTIWVQMPRMRRVLTTEAPAQDAGGRGLGGLANGIYGGSACRCLHRRAS
jgi:hypothetical protein